MPGQLSHPEIVWVRQLPIFQHGFSLFLILKNRTSETVWIKVSDFSQSVRIFTHPSFMRRSSCIHIHLGIYFGCAASPGTANDCGPVQ